MNYSIEQLVEKISIEVDKLRFKTEPALLYRPIEYTLHQGGKRLRPLLSLVSCQMFNGNVDESLIPAVSLEMFHNFTLIHDDIMDQAPIRRGVDTVYKKWNENVAILSGDTLFAMAYDHLMQYEKEQLRDLIKLLNVTAIGVCEGQQMDMDFETQKHVTIDEYIEMIRLKTAILIGACLKAGAITANASKEEQQQIYQYGESIGLAFQLMDDLLDVFGDVTKFGKTNGGDIRENKKTFLYLKSLELATGEDLKALQHYFSSTDFNQEEKFEAVKGLYEKLNLKAITEDLMNAYYNEAQSHLNNIKLDDRNKKQLIELTDGIMQRDH
jgi:geranylgeranyl diphosphate synthase, type II